MRPTMGHCCNDPRAESTTHANGRANAHKRHSSSRADGQKAVRWPRRWGLSGVVHLAACSFSTPHTGEKKRRKKRSARYGAPRKYHQRRSSRSVILLAAAWARGAVARNADERISLKRIKCARNFGKWPKWQRACALSWPRERLETA